MPQEQRGLPETSFDEGITVLEGFIHESDKPAKLEEAREIIKKSGLQKKCIQLVLAKKWK